MLNECLLWALSARRGWPKTNLGELAGQMISHRGSKRAFYDWAESGLSLGVGHGGWWCVDLPVKKIVLGADLGAAEGSLVRHGCVSLGRRDLYSELASRAGESARCTLGHLLGHLSQNSFSSVSINSLGPSSVACFQPSFFSFVR